MALRDEFNDEENVELETGIPTITFCEEDRQVMIPWMSFRHGLMEEERIRLYFQGWVVEIKGDSLESLWTELQAQSVRSVSLSDDGSEGLSRISVETV
jgi:hypothetical protein